MGLCRIQVQNFGGVESKSKFSTKSVIPFFHENSAEIPFSHFPIMAKRGSSALTGGSGDVNPQWMCITITQTSTDVLTTISVPLPVQRLSQKTGKSMVMEILRIYWDVPAYTVAPAQGIVVWAALTTKNPNLPNGPSQAQLNAVQASGITVDYINRLQACNSAAAGSFYNVDEPIVRDLTDGSGHGVLIGTDNLFVTLSTQISGSTATGAVNHATCRVLYRWKDVALQEYIGIVQSQQ